MEGNQRKPRRPGRRRLSTAVIAILLGGGAALLVLMAMLLMVLREATPLLTETELAAAVQRWREYGPDDYDMDILVGGRRAGTIHVEVRGGSVVAMTRDGITPSQQRTWQYWSVPGLFDMLEDDVQSADDPRGPFGALPGTKVVLRAEFNPRYGYPRRYQRTVFGTDLGIDWEIVRFAIRPATDSSRDPPPAG